MASTIRGFWQALIPLWFLLVCAFAQSGCTCTPMGQVPSKRTIACRPQHGWIANEHQPKSNRQICERLIKYAINDA